jgi:ABC-type nitrate/sulfonate/bicarbonate transport system substrate-binding protein
LTKASRSTRWRKANPDKARSQVKTETERYRETRAAYYQANKRLWQNKRLQAEYGITIEEYDAERSNVQPEKHLQWTMTTIPEWCVVFSARTAT